VAQAATIEGISTAPRPMIPDLRDLASLVRLTAREELLPRFASVKREFKDDGSVVTVADGAVQARLSAALGQRWPDYRLLGEEMTAEEQAALVAEPGPGLWVLDPLDGTSNFAAGIPFFSVSLALLAGGESVLGVVYDPTRDECFTARKGRGVWLNDEPLRRVAISLLLKRAIAAVDFKRLPVELAARFAAEPPYASQRSFGSVALDWCWVAAGRFHVYLHGRQKLWDYAAGHLILAEAGGYACTLAGERVPLASNEPRAAVAALDRALFEEWWDWIRGG